ncbi:hypothetical protein QQF73_14830 [Marinobacter sp. M216]|uniref:Uncharacterized protein n=1 Tax=Marinobacter albus TaxID=3030833 RepID=A0ABT7HG82_9GAMM|nr:MULTISPECIES: hypothetical protein [unclassified Marinobacter]MBW7472357.1 hypothetical protein [Marinobacter sp. F4218]MDK9558907.1 hypothetical protein [Marinobacter sp. M216]
MSLGAAAAEDLDVTMRMVLDDAELTESVVREIELPMATPSELQRGKSVSNPDSSQDGLNSSREVGQSVADDARGARGSVDAVREKPELPEKINAPQKPERPEVSSDAKDRAQDIRGKTPPGLDR